MDGLDDAIIEVANALQGIAKARALEGEDAVAELGFARDALREAEQHLESALVEAEHAAGDGHEGDGGAA